MLNLTQEEMAARVGVKQPEISKLENGERRLTLDVLSSIVTSVGGEWELTVKLPDIGIARLTSNEEFENKVSPRARRGHKRRIDASKRKVERAKNNCKRSRLNCLS
jgi:transcriptional regulator with XRE-family HTH domain